MIDCHSHILPGFDDGAQTLEDSIAMAQMAQADGIRQIVATPHNADWREGYQCQTVLDAVSRLQRELTGQGIKVEIVPGVEARIAPDLIKQMEKERAFTLNGSRYLLLELPLSAYPLYTEQVIFELQIKGITPILAHPERNVVIKEDPNLLCTLVERGVLAQLTAASLVGVFGSPVKEMAKLFLEHNLAHIIASDAHTLDRRSPVLSLGVAEAARTIGEERARAMVTTVPELILADQDIGVEPPVRYKPRKRWFWR